MIVSISICLLLSMMASVGHGTDMQLSINEATANEILDMYIGDERLAQDDEGSLAGAMFEYSLDIDFVDSEEDSAMLTLMLDVSASATLEHLGQITEIVFDGQIQAQYYVYFDGFHFLIHPFSCVLIGSDIPEWCCFCITELLSEKLRDTPVAAIEACFPVDTSATAFGTGYDIWFENPWLDFESSPEGVEASFDMFARLDFETGDFEFHHIFEMTVSVSYNPVITDETIIAEFVGAEIAGVDIPLWLVLIAGEFFEVELTEIPLYEGALFEFEQMDQTVDIEFIVILASFEVTDERVGVNAWLCTNGTAPSYDLDVELSPSGDYVINSVTCNVESDILIRIYNCVGYLVKEYSGILYPGENSDWVYVGDLTSGYYHYRNHYCNDRKTYPASEKMIVIVH